jgi:hypothetical protein
MYVPTYTHDQEEEIDLKVYKNNEKTPYKKNHKMNTIKEERDDDGGNNSDGSDTAYFNGEDDTFNNRDDEDEEEEDKELDNRYD